jgi:nucleotide-binding universal stress UspA family protein
MDMTREQARQPPGALVVGVDGGPASQAAAGLAADLAERLRAPVHLVHAQSASFHADGGADPGADQPLGVAERERERLGDRHPGQAVSAAEAAGHADDVLVEGSASARLVVLGRPEPRHGLRAIRRSLAERVVGRAECPVLGVRPDDGWRPASRIVVGVDAEEHSGAPLDWTLDTASALGVPVHVVHAWWWEPAEPLLTGEVWEGDWAEEALGEEIRLAELMAGRTPAHPDVVVTTEVVRGLAGDVVVDASRDAALVVVGRHRGGRTSVLGSVARAVLRDAHSPVVVVPNG